MAKIAIIGAGELGKALCKLIMVTSDHEILCVDTDITACADLEDECDTLRRPKFQELMYPSPPIEILHSESHTVTKNAVKNFAPEVIVCANESLEDAADIAFSLDLHCVSFSEDHEAVLKIQKNETSKTFVLQTGLAPGLLNYFAIDVLNEQLDTKMLTMACGSLPDVVLGDSALTRTKNIESVLREHLQPALILENGAERYLDPLTDVASLRVSGVEYETFIAGSGIGEPSAYDVPNVCYRNIAFPGHLSAILSKLEDNDDPVSGLAEAFQPITDDYVIMAVIAEDVFGRLKTSYMSFGSCTEPGLQMSAQTFASVCTAAGVIQLILEEQLPAGHLNADQISLSDLEQTAAMAVFDRSLMYAGRK